MLSHLEQKLGIVTEACNAMGLKRSIFYNWLEKDPEFRSAVDEIRETVIDYVEGKLFQRVQGVTMGKQTENGPIIYEIPPSDTAIIFYLKTKAKHRGYIERNEIGFEPDRKFEITLKV